MPEKEATLERVLKEGEENAEFRESGERSSRRSSTN
jgi:hypothetical protein